MFKKWVPKKAAIRISKRYNSVQMPETYLIKTDKQIKDIINHIKENEDIYCRNMAREDSLSANPTLRIVKEDNVFMPNELDVPIMVTVHYNYESPRRETKTRTSVLPFILLFLTALIVFNVMFMVEGAKQTRLNNMCKVYYQHGEATHIMLGDKEFDLNNITQEDMVFLNPWEREILNNTKISECLRIDKR